MVTKNGRLQRQTCQRQPSHAAHCASSSSHTQTQGIQLLVDSAPSSTGSYLDNPVLVLEGDAVEETQIQRGSTINVGTAGKRLLSGATDGTVYRPGEGTEEPHEGDNFFDSGGLEDGKGLEIALQAGQVRAIQLVVLCASSKVEGNPDCRA